MKSKASFFIILILLLISKITMFSQNRNVVWVHGLGGDASSWQHYANIFQNERKIFSARPTYNYANGLSPAATQLKNAWTNTAATNIGIGHSMGGVVIREVDRNTTNDKRFGGFITIASPNYGAPISANVLNGNAVSVIANAVAKLTAGPSVDPVWAPITILAGTLSVAIIQNNLNTIKNYFSQATNNDLKEGSNAMNNLNNYSSATHKISIIAEETSPVHWRMIGSMIHGAGSSGNPGDAKMAGNVSILRSFYNAKYIFYLGGIFTIPLAFKWKQGRDWLDDSQSIWCSLIKASRLEQQTTTNSQWVPCPTGPGGQTKPKLPTGQTGCCDCWIHTPVTTWVTVTYKTDGLLPTYAQELKGVPSGNRYVIDHANHMELKNMTYSINKNGQTSDGTKNTMNAIFDKQQGDFFRTERKTP
ncbi:MAG: hypothetical protein FWH18_07500 [Marinilabiliaceae bacterium]|nr:hypothetical protein [Marinilabiliaceae bacterium]